MIQIFAYSRQEELQQLRELAAEVSVQWAWAECELHTTYALQEWSRWIEEADCVDALICDVSRPEMISALKRARALHTGALVVPIADQTVPPATYVQPEILPYALFWRPLNAAGNRETMKKLMLRISSAGIEPSKQCFQVITKQKVVQVPYSDIYYFEARDKKIYLRLEQKELCFRGTLVQLQEQLPDTFLRCHKSFLVNKDHLLQVDWAAQTIQLSDRISVPLSRSYRGRIKEELYGTDQ